MQKPKIKELCIQAFETLKKLICKIPLPSMENIYGVFSSWGRLFGLALILFLCLYYPIGGSLVNNIDTNISIDINEKNRSQSATVEMMSFIINREVNQNSWTPNLPFFFPSYFLDNMPNFQLGMMSSVANLSKCFAARVGKTSPSENLAEASVFLQYPGTIWMFSPQNKLAPVPSAHSQYRKARSNLLKYNQKLGEGIRTFQRSPDDLSAYLKVFSNKISVAANKIDSHVREESRSFIDNRADDLFYHTKGVLYADYLLLKALAFDYQDIIVNRGLYADWTKMQKALENAIEISPAIVRNGEKDSTLAPNHLISIGFYAQRAQIYMKKIAQELDKKPTIEGPQL